MRLMNYEVKAIKKVILSLDEKATIYLFGSRVRNDQKGGDIDLLVFSKKLRQEDAWIIRDKLYDLIGEQKIDIIIVQDTSHPFTRLALKESVKL